MRKRKIFQTQAVHLMLKSVEHSIQRKKLRSFGWAEKIGIGCDISALGLGYQQRAFFFFT
jgi:hypothetical protein